MRASALTPRASLPLRAGPLAREVLMRRREFIATFAAVTIGGRPGATLAETNGLKRVSASSTRAVLTSRAHRGLAREDANPALRRAASALSP
jgi:hypothetical protein